MYQAAQVAPEDFATAAWTDAKQWLNAKVAKDLPDKKNADQYFQSLTLALQLCLQEAADQTEIAASNILGSKLPVVEAKRKQMAVEQKDARTRIGEILDLHAKENQNHKHQAELVAIKEAKEKIELIRRALKRKTRFRSCVLHSYS